MPTFYLILSTLALFIGLLITYWVHSRLGLEIIVEPVPPPQNAPLVSVIVPARDEARNIRRCVQALLDQSYPEIELIVVDDRSRDGTSAILANLQAKNSRLKNY